MGLTYLPNLCIITYVVSQSVGDTMNIHRITFNCKKEKYREFYKRVIDNNCTMTDVLNGFIDKYLSLEDKNREIA